LPRWRYWYIKLQSNQLLEANQQHKKQDIVQEFFENFNFKIFLYVIKKSRIFTLGLLLLAIIVPFLYVRYTTPIYETSATLIKKKEIKNNLLDEKSTDFLKSNDEEKINRDIQIIKSDYLLNSIIDSVGLNVSYFKVGRLQFKKTETLENEPISVYNERVLNPSIYNIPIEISFNKNNTYHIEYEIQGKQLNYENIPLDSEFKCKDFILRLRTSKLDDARYQIVFNDRETIKNYIVGNLAVSSGSPNIFFNIKSENGQKSERLLGKVLAGFLRQDQIENSEKVENSLTYIKNFMDTLNIQLRKSQIEKTNYAIQNNIYSPDNQLTSSLEEIIKYKEKIELAREKLMQLESVNKSLENGTKFPTQSLNDPELMNLLTEKNKLLIDYKPTHPTIEYINRSINNKILERKNSIKSEMNLYQQNIQTMSGLTSQTRKDLVEFPNKGLQLNSIQKELEVKEKYVLELLEKQIQYLILKSSISSDYLIIQPPKTKLELVSPKKTYVYVSSFLLFIIFSLSIYFYRYSKFDKIVSIEEVKRYTKVPILGYVPYVKEAEVIGKSKNAPESRLVVIKHPKSRTAEIFKKMRASLKYTSVADYKVIASTSTTSGEGKTFVLINLAAVHALLDKKVIIIDLDLRKPRISKSFKIANEVGMSNLLSSNELTIDQCIQKSIVLENLDIITSGPVPPNPSELIISDKFKIILDELKSKYDYIFIDTPPVGLVNESIELINQADIPLYLVRFNYSRKDYLSTLNEINKLKKGSPLLMVINHFGDGASSYVNYDYGGYGYSYGYGDDSGYHKTTKGMEEGYYTHHEEIIKKSFIEKIKDYFDYNI
jgi:tyrosine-protein kinase Etk/Wzc